MSSFLSNSRKAGAAGKTQHKIGAIGLLGLWVSIQSIAGPAAVAAVMLSATNSSAQSVRVPEPRPGGGVIRPGFNRLLEPSPVREGEVESRCLYRWDDSHQFHSKTVVVTPSEQVVRTTWKKLEYCIRLKVTGPIDVEGIAKSYVNKCVDYGLKKNSTRHALEAVVAIGIDVLSAGATGGAATIAKLADYTKSVTDNTMECLSDAEGITGHIKTELKRSFEATVKKESKWVYWNL